MKSINLLIIICISFLSCKSSREYSSINYYNKEYYNSVRTDVHQSHEKKIWVHIAWKDSPLTNEKILLESYLRGSEKFYFEEGDEGSYYIRTGKINTPILESKELIEISNMREKLPLSFRNYMLDWQPTCLLGAFEFKNTAPDTSISKRKVLVPFFPDSIDSLPSYFLVFAHSNYFKDTISKLDTVSYITIRQGIFVFYPTTSYYKGFIIKFWDDYIYWLNFHELKDDYPQRITSRRLNRKSQDNFRLKVSNYLKNNIKSFHKSYFEIILWQVYQPTDFKLSINDSKGETASFIFTSNNPEYPGNYEVKFNIYQPYYFKVFKR